MTKHQCQFPQLSKLHILFTKPEASGVSVILETEMDSEDKPGEFFNWKICSSHHLRNHSIHIYPASAGDRCYEVKTEESERLAVDRI